ncbi:MAG: hypothetical protein M0R48_03210 [Candidatus Omnitrophica bacterium]|jgi:hypothetical protein|nr:hypothetical protein [Candidatus Omnitrophota bacterium]
MRILVYLVVILLCGCAKIAHLNELLTLKRVGDNQKQIEIYLAKQERGFNKLSDDIKNSRLIKGQLKRSVIAKYSEPVLTKCPGPENAGIKEILLYRHPTNRLKSDRIYLYFDNASRLVYWELKPADN